MITAIILAGGVGSRVGADRPKQFVEILNKPVLAYTVDIFQRNSQIDAIEIVCHKSWKDYLTKMISNYDFTKVKWIVDGGKTFQESVENGIENLKSELKPDDYVLIQYGAAPFTSERIVDDVIRVMKSYNSAVSGTPVYQLIGSRDENQTSKTWYDRDKFVQVVCPYGFKYSYIQDVYRRSAEKGLLETIEPHTTTLIYALGDKLHLAYGDQTNIKITTKEDLRLFEGYALLRQRKQENGTKGGRN